MAKVSEASRDLQISTRLRGLASLQPLFKLHIWELPKIRGLINIDPKIVGPLKYGQPQKLPPIHRNSRIPTSLEGHLGYEGAHQRSQ